MKATGRPSDLLLSRLQSVIGDRYCLESRIAEGGMATVFRAQDRKLNRPVALKLLQQRLRTAIGLTRFQREVSIAAELAHPHIVPLFDADRTTDDQLFYTMPLLEGDTLRSRLERDRHLPVLEAIRIAREVADALAYAHSRGFVHRDIKPENIMFVGDHAVVTDFGIARAISAAADMGESGPPIGTLPYMSPEQTTNGPIDGRSDIYSLGCVLYEMLTGTVPLAEPKPLRAVRATVPAALEASVMRSLARTPVDRYASSADFRDALAAPGAATAAVDPRSIAVLPFINQSGDPALEYLSDGLAEEIIGALTQVPGLRVAARTSSFSFRGKEAGLSEIGAQLRVATVLEGSVRKADTELRVSARLATVADGFTLWSRHYDNASMTQVFEIEDHIARSIAQELRVAFTDWEGKPARPAKAYFTAPTRNPEAYDLYLQGRYQLAQRGLGLARSLELFERAIALDPDFALAHAGLAEAYTVLAQYGLVPTVLVGARAAAAAERALELGPDLAEAHCARGALSMICDWDWNRAAAGFQRAVQLAPTYVTARLWLAFYLVFVEGRFDAGVAQAERAVELDPLSPLATMQLGMTLLGTGRYEQSAALLERARGLARDMFLPPLHLGLLYNQIGRTRDAIRTLEDALVISGRHPWTLSALAVCYASQGDVGKARAIREELVARARHEYVQSSMLAVLAALVGQMDEAFALLDQATDEHDGILVYAKRYPFFNVLQSDPRMARIFDRVGL